MFLKLIKKYSLKFILPIFLLLNVLLGISLTAFIMSFFTNPNYQIALTIAFLCSFFGPLLLITPSIILYLHIEEVTQLSEQNYRIDSLTNLLSRKPFSIQLHKILEEEDTNTIGLLFIDLDQFKKINTSYGHMAGDEVLTKVGNILLELTPKNACIARYGGEEFVGLITDIERREFEILANNIKSSLDSKISYEGYTIPFSASIGGVLNYTSDCQYDSLLSLADKQMYKAKDNGRNRVEIVDLTKSFQ